MSVSFTAPSIIIPSAASSFSESSRQYLREPSELLTVSESPIDPPFHTPSADTPSAPIPPFNSSLAVRTTSAYHWTSLTINRNINRNRAASEHLQTRHKRASSYHLRPECALQESVTPLTPITSIGDYAVYTATPSMEDESRPSKYSEIHFNVPDEDSHNESHSKYQNSPHLPVTPYPSLTEFDPNKRLSAVMDTHTPMETSVHSTSQISHSMEAESLYFNLNVNVDQKQNPKEIVVTPMTSSPDPTSIRQIRIHSVQTTKVQTSTRQRRPHSVHEYKTMDIPVETEPVSNHSNHSKHSKQSKISNHTKHSKESKPLKSVIPSTRSQPADRPLSDYNPMTRLNRLNHNELSQLTLIDEEAVGEQRVIRAHGYRKVKSITSTLQGTVFLAVADTNTNNTSTASTVTTSSESVVVIKRTSKLLHSQGITKKINGRFYPVDENVLKEYQIMRRFGRRRNCPTQITKALDMFESEDNYYLVMEHAGSDFLKFVVKAHELIRSGKLTLKTWRKFAKYLFYQMAYTVNWLHNEMNCCHLDISLENLAVQNGDFQLQADGTYTINPQIRVKFIDFGLAEFFDRRRGGKIGFQCVKYCGKRQYKSPEVESIDSV